MEKKLVKVGVLVNSFRRGWGRDEEDKIIKAQL